MDALKKFFTNRITYLSLGLIIVMCILVGRLYVLQIGQNEIHEKEAAKFTEYDLPLDAPRGNIYDRNGVLLAGNRTAYKVYMINTDDDQEYRDRMYLELVKIFEKNNDVFYNYLADYLIYPPAWGPAVDTDEEAENMKAFINDMVISKADKVYFENPQSAFNYLRVNLFAISDEYSEYDAYRIMIMRFASYMYGLD